MSQCDYYKLAAPESGADDEPPKCDIDGCGNEGLNMVGTGYGTTFRCDEHKPGAVHVGGSAGCSGGCE